MGCSLRQQKVMAKYIHDIFGDNLYCDPVDGDFDALPSPEFLKNKILVKGKKLKVSSTERTDGQMGSPTHGTYNFGEEDLYVSDEDEGLDMIEEAEVGVVTIEEECMKEKMM